MHQLITAKIAPSLLCCSSSPPVTHCTFCSQALCQNHNYNIWSFSVCLPCRRQVKYTNNIHPNSLTLVNYNHEILAYIIKTDTNHTLIKDSHACFACGDIRPNKYLPSHLCIDCTQLCDIIEKYQAKNPRKRKRAQDTMHQNTDAQNANTPSPENKSSTDAIFAMNLYVKIGNAPFT